MKTKEDIMHEISQRYNRTTISIDNKLPIVMFTPSDVMEAMHLYAKEVVSENIVSDVRNKLSPVKNLVVMIEEGVNMEYILKQLETIKGSIEYLSNLKA